MAYCKNCGQQIDDNAVVCVHCGVAVGKFGVPDDAKSIGFAILSFFFPLVGLILYLVWKTESPLKASSCGKGALIGVIVEVVMFILYFVFIMSLVASIPYSLAGLMLI